VIRLLWRAILSWFGPMFDCCPMPACDGFVMADKEWRECDRCHKAWHVDSAITPENATRRPPRPGEPLILEPEMNFSRMRMYSTAPPPAERDPGVLVRM
jgi:hypothetical protein